MKKIGVLVFILLLFGCVAINAQEESSGKIEKYAEIAGENLLKIQEFLTGTLIFLSFGAFGEGGTFAFAQFLFMVLVFLLIYSIAEFIPIISSKIQIPFALAFTVLAFVSVDVQEIQTLLTGYESMGIAITVILPVLMLLAFTFRMYQKAYEGKSEKSPFYAKLFNLVFLIFFGVFFIRYSVSEEGVIAVMRFWSGYFLIGLGVAQFFFIYKLFAMVFSDVKARMVEEGKRIRKERQEDADKKYAVEKETSKIRTS